MGVEKVMAWLLCSVMAKYPTAEAKSSSLRRYHKIKLIEFNTNKGCIIKYK